MRGSDVVESNFSSQWVGKFWMGVMLLFYTEPILVVVSFSQ